MSIKSKFKEVWYVGWYVNTVSSDIVCAEDNVTPVPLIAETVTSVPVIPVPVTISPADILLSAVSNVTEVLLLHYH